MADELWNDPKRMEAIRALVQEAIDDAAVGAVTECVESGWLGIDGDKLEVYFAGGDVGLDLVKRAPLIEAMERGLGQELPDWRPGDRAKVLNHDFSFDLNLVKLQNALRCLL